MDDLLRYALVGTATQVPPAFDHPADVISTSVREPERSVLLRAGTRAIWRDAGYLPRRNLPPIEPCPPDGIAPVSDRASLLLRSALERRSGDILPLFLQRLAAAGSTLPADLLPAALSPAGKSNELREQIRAVLGVRGRWLASLNPDWSWAACEGLAAADAETLRRVWEEGTTAERVDALTRLRQLDPADARSRLEQVFKNEKADVRSRLLEPFSTSLSVNDEPFLEATLDDRSEIVRATSAGLLASIPTSRFVARMTERADAMLSGERSGLPKKTLTLVCNPPTEIGKDWVRDGMSKTAPPGTGKGPRALWIEAVIGCVPPGHWTSRFEMTSEQLVAALPEDFGEEIVAGWTTAATRPGAAEGEAWLPTLADYWSERFTAAERSGTAGMRQRWQAVERLRKVFAGLGRIDAERRLAEMLRGGGAGNDAALLLLPGLPRPWSATFAREWLSSVVATMSEKRRPQGYDWGMSTPVVTAALPEVAFDEAIAAFERLAADGDNPDRAAAFRFAESLRQRREFYEAVPLQSLAG